MTVGASTMEEQMQEMKKMLEEVLKGNAEKNKKLEELQKEVNKLHDKRKIEGGPPILMEEDEAKKIIPAEILKKKDDSYDGDKLQLMIANTVKSQLNGDSTGGVRYNKPYTKRINDLQMPLGYQPPKFQQFDGKGNSKQHVAHFVETCNNAGTEGDLLVKQFVRSLKGMAFDWYTDLVAGSIDSWGQMEAEFFNRFYSTRRVVSMSELTNTKQWEEEPVVDYINRWRALSLECKDRISETSAVEMCIDGMNWDLLYILKGIKPRSFQELATRAHNMEITVKGHKNDHISSSKAFGEAGQEESDEPCNRLGEEAMVITANNASAKSSSKSKDFKRDWPPLKEMLAKKYPFPDSDLSDMLDNLLKKGIIQLPEAKRPEEVDMINNPKYCRYHRMVSHGIEDCITLKELVMKLVSEGRILLDDDEMVEANHTTITTCNDPLQKPHELQGQMIKFGSLPSTKMRVHKPVAIPELEEHNQHALSQSNKKVADDEGWILVTSKKSRKQPRIQPETVHHKSAHWSRKRRKHLEEKKMPKKVVKPGGHQKEDEALSQQPSLEQDAKAPNVQAHSFMKAGFLPNAPGAVAMNKIKK